MSTIEESEWKNGRQRCTSSVTSEDVRASGSELTLEYHQTILRIISETLDNVSRRATLLEPAAGECLHAILTL